MSASLFHEWMAFDQLDPDPGPRIEFMLARMSAMYANTHLDRRHRSSLYKVNDFMLERFDAPQKTSQTPEQTFGMVKAWAILCGATKVQ